MVLVTGGTGMLGAYIIHELLLNNKRVRALRRSTSNTTIIERVFSFLSNDKTSQLLDKIEWVEGDLCYFDDVVQMLDGVDAVYNCAAMVSFAKEDKEKLLDFNVNGTKTLVDASIACGISQFCHISSIASLGSADNGDPVTEKSERNEGDKRRSNYSNSKYLSEMEVWRGVHEGLNAVIVNPSVILGVGDWSKGSAALFSTIGKGMKFYPKGQTGFVDALDVARASIALLKEQLYGQRFILSGKNVLYQTLFGDIAAVLGTKKPTIKVGDCMGALAWRAKAIQSFFSGKTPSITKETIRASKKKVSYSNEKVKKAIAYTFLPLSETITNIGREYLKTTTTITNR